MVGVAFAGMAASSKTTNNWDTVVEMINSLDQKITALQGDVAAIRCRLGIGGGVESFNVDLQVTQLATATFYSDWHAGWKDINGNDNLNDATTFSDNVWGRTNPDTVAWHYYPTAIENYANHVLTLSTTQFDSVNPTNPLVIGAGSAAATDSEIKAHAIWMGLLVNNQGSGTTDDGSQDRGWVSPLQLETSIYLYQIPISAMAGDSYNGGINPCGHYCWVVGKNGSVYGAYKSTDGNWYSGYNGDFP